VDVLRRQPEAVVLAAQREVAGAEF
jgi:hypothetical protein